MSLRRTTISKCFAVWLFVLVTSPFTAPFATLDLSDNARPVGTDVRTPVHDDAVLKFKIVSESALVGVPAWNVLPPFLVDTATASINPTCHADRLHIQHSILRL